MIKTILSIIKTQHYHPAVGQLYKIIFTDNTEDLVYEETFFHQVDSWYSTSGKYGIDWLVGKTLNTNEDYYNLNY